MLQLCKCHSDKQTHQIPTSTLPLKMDNALFLIFLLLQTFSKVSSLDLGVSIGIGGGGGGGVWIGGGISSPTAPSGTSSSSNLKNVYIALQTWKSSITDDPQRVLETWVGSNVCSYKGIFCADLQNEFHELRTAIVGIDLNSANLQGTLVKELSFLTDLSLLHLNSNRFTGTIPNTFQYLSSLKELDLSNNHFSGPFPTPTLFIPNLLYLDLRFNNFSGPIPESLFDARFDAIFLNNNNFDGPLPSNLGNSLASVINLANNKFTGSIPFSFGLMDSPKLKEILFLNNQLSGCIPEGIGLWQGLQVLDLSFNSLMGQLPDSLSCLTEIEILNLAHNRFYGEVPDLVCSSLRGLRNLSLAVNFFSGFSQECDKLVFRNVGFDFSLNCIPGRGMQRPEPECSVIPGGGLSCLRIPALSPLVCGTLFETQETSLSPPPP
ncbi:leucine-rich repeat extensin-like protein 4 [Camellia sinensis]|uniref:leucine-rich repeat extensin-like protein 4 n=1 Tax=Camellia sinensis TaxID=4442 RepID=UPI001036BE0E|nr:leucine-rich repeat extensin-like protein 4 [Camellia sinensis]